MKVSLPILYSQLDDRWAKLLLGFNVGATFNFYNYACLVSSLAEVARYYGHDETPITINDKLKGLGVGAGFQAGGANYVWGAFSKLFGEIKETKTECPGKLTDAQIGEIKSALDKGFPVMVQIDVNPKTVANDTHYSLLVDYDPNDENNFTLADTLGGQHVSLKKYLGWLRPSARESIYKYVIYEGKVPAGSSTVAVPADIYPNIIHGSTEFDKTVNEYLPGRDPKSTNFEDVRSVVGGYKSRATSMENERNDALKELATTQKEVENQKDKVANQAKDCQMQIQAKDAEISSLLAGAPAQATYVDSLKAQLEELRGQMRVAQKAGGEKDLQITSLQSDLETCKNKQVVVPAPVQPVDTLTVQELLTILIQRITKAK